MGARRKKKVTDIQYVCSYKELNVRGFRTNSK
jgi:hypothetical protein